MPEHRIIAALYDRSLAGCERSGLRALRAEVLGAARGRTLELGAGTGLNLRHYPDSVSELVLTEPDPFMAARLRRRLAQEPPRPPAVEVIEAPAEELPFEDGGFDTIVSTLVLCTVPDPERAAAEAARVLRPEGRLLHIEHVRSPDGARLACWQDRLERPWGWITGGCHPNRPTEQTLASAGFDTSEVASDRMPSVAGPLIRPIVRGAARRPGGEAK